MQVALAARMQTIAAAGSEVRRVAERVRVRFGRVIARVP